MGVSLLAHPITADRSFMYILYPSQITACHRGRVFLSHIVLLFLLLTLGSTEWLVHATEYRDDAGTAQNLARWFGRQGGSIAC